MSCCWCSENIYIIQTLLSALLTGFPPPHPGLQLGDKCKFVRNLKCQLFFLANGQTAFAAVISLPGLGVLARTQRVQPARAACPVTPYFLESEESVFCIPTVFSCLQVLLSRIRWNPVLDADKFHCCPSKALINIKYSSTDAKSIPSQTTAVLCLPPWRPQACSTVCARTEYSSPLNSDWKDLWSVILSSGHVPGFNSCCCFV